MWIQRALLTVLLASFLAGLAVAEDDTVRRASQLIQDGKEDQAIELLTSYVEDHEADPLAFGALANAYHSKGDYEKAIAANDHAAATSWAAPTAHYNSACALSLLGRADDAYAALNKAIAAGFLDFDLMATDTDLKNMRAAHELQMPPVNEYVQFKAHNNVELAYKVITPAGYDPSKTYPALVVFAPGNGTRSADWAIENLVGPGDTSEWIVVYPIAPERGWFTHPSHHALNDMLKTVREDYKIVGNKYDLSGYASGARVASTYSQMSREYFTSLTTFSAWHWRQWDDDDLASSFNMPIRLVVGAQDELGRGMNEHVKEMIGRKAKLDVIAANDHTLASIRDGRLIEYIAR